MSNRAKMTEEQKLAVDANGCSLIVSAAAGSGKTFVLVERLLDLISKKDDKKPENPKFPVEDMIVVTFTKNAAAEMKQRLMTALAKKIKEEPNNDLLIRQHSMLPNAKITTINSFCFDLLRDNIDIVKLATSTDTEVPISVKFKIISEEEENLYLLRVIKEVINDEYNSNLEDMNFLTQSICNKTDNDLEKILISLYKFLMTIPFFEDWFKSNVLDYYSYSDIPNDVIMEGVFSKCLEVFPNAYELNRKAIDLCKSLETQDTYTLETLTNDEILILKAIEVLKTLNMDMLTIINSLETLFNGFDMIEPIESNPLVNEILLIRSEYEKLIKNITYNGTNIFIILKSRKVLESITNKNLNADTIETLEKALELSEDALSQCDQIENEKTRDTWANIIESDNIFIEKLLDCLKNDTLDFNKYPNPVDMNLNKTKGGKDIIKSEISAIRKEYVNLLKSIDVNTMILKLKDVLKYYSEDKIINYNVSKILYDLIISIHYKLNVIKSEDSILTFSDSEQLAVKLLSKKDEYGNIVKTSLAKELTNSYKIIMIDEFQDSNNNEDLIFKLLSKNGNSKKMGNNMFVVGDVKQSIYCFKLSNPKNFINVMEYSKPYTKENTPRNSYINLNQNFRSSLEVINFVNYIFENVMSKEVGEIVYNNEEKLKYGANYPETGEKWFTELPLIDTEKYSEVDYTVETIKYMLEHSEEYPVYEKDSITNELKPRGCRPSDFCLLFNASTHINDFVEKFEQMGLAVDYDDKKSKFLKSREISLLVNMIKVIDYPTNNIALTSIMMSPIYMFTPDDVSNIRLLDRNSSIYSSLLEMSGKDVSKLKVKRSNSNNAITFKLCNRECKYAISKSNLQTLNDYINKNNNINYTIELVNKSKHLIDDINYLRNLSANCTTYELISNIIDKTDFISIIQVYDASDKRVQNVRKFLNIAQSHDDNSTTGISGFIRYINDLMNNDKDFNVKSNTPLVDSINIKTIHGSKGLEFPYVFLCRSLDAFNEDDLNDKIIKNFDYGLSYNLIDRNSLTTHTSLDFIKIRNEKLSELRSEKMRLMYVALTRAKQKLFIPLSVCNKSTKSGNNSETTRFKEYVQTIQTMGTIPSKLVKSKRTMKDWLILALCCSDKAQPLRDFYNVSLEKNPIECNANINMYVYTPKDTTQDTQSIEDNHVMESETVIVEENPFADEIISNCKDFKYNSNMTDIPARISVSKIVKSYLNSTDNDTLIDNTNPPLEDDTHIELEKEYSLDLRLPNFIVSNELTPAEKGIAVHTVMQYCNFNNLKDNIHDEISRLKNDGFITQSQFDVIDYSMFERLINSDLFNIILNNIDNVYRERDFLVKVSELPNLDDDIISTYKGTDTMLQGCVDMIIVEDDGITLIDYKTDKASLKTLKERYSLQIKLYKSAIELIESKPVKKALIYSMRIGKSIEIL